MRHRRDIKARNAHFMRVLSGFFDSVNLGSNPSPPASLFRFPFLPPLRAVGPVRRSAASLAGRMQLMLAILSPDAEIVCASRPFLLYSAARLRGCFACRGGNHADDH